MSPTLAVPVRPPAAPAGTSPRQAAPAVAEEPAPADPVPPAIGSPEPHEDEVAAVGAALTVAAVARRLGVAPATLRTWDRRYGVGPSAHTSGHHRRYTPSDVQRLVAMRRLVLEGVTPAEAAGTVLDAVVPPAPTSFPRSPALRSGRRGVPALPDPVRPEEVRGLGRAAALLDAEAVCALVSTSLARRGVVATWQDLLLPVLVTTGARWAASGEGIEVEHLLSEAVLRELRAHTAPLAARPPVNPRPVLLACAPEEQHSLPLQALAAALAERRIGVRLLGARTPAVALAAAVRRTGPAAVVLWARLPLDPAEAEAVVAAMPVQRPPATVVAAGPGWPQQLPDGVEAAASLPEALERVVSSLGV